jgi:hypothetical protein
LKAGKRWPPGTLFVRRFAVLRRWFGLLVGTLGCSVVITKNNIQE